MAPGLSKARIGRGLAIALLLAGVLAIAALGAMMFGGGLRGWVLSAASHRIGRPIHVDGRTSLSPGLAGLTVRFDQLHVDQPGWAGGGDMVRVRHGAATLPWSALLGDARISALELDGFTVALKHDAAGRANWAGHGAGPPRLPRIGRLTLRDGVLDLDDRQRQLSFHGTVATRQLAGRAPDVIVQGGGRSRGDPWTLVLAAGERIAVEPSDLSLRLTLDQAAGASRLGLDGRVSAGAKRVEGRITAAGPDLHNLSQLLLTPLFRTPPYALQAHVVGTAKDIRLQGMTGRVGASDLEGDVVITPSPGGRRLDAKAHSRSLRISDLFSVVSGGKLIADRKPGRLLPASSLNPVPLRPLVGVIDYAADSVQAPTRPAIRSLRLHAVLDHGQVSTDPLEMTLARGRTIVRFAIDGRSDTPKVRLGLDLQHADTAEFQTGGVGKAPLQAVFDAQLSLAGQGRSLPDVVDTAYGRFRLRTLSGRIQRAQADILSAELADGVIALLSGRGQTVALRCAVADFGIRNGQAQVRTLRLSTAMGEVSGSGGLDLGTEAVDLTLRRVGGAPTAVRISGPLAKPRTTLSIDRPLAAVKRSLVALLHIGPKPSQPAGCG